jgi:hypothetical protein
MLIEFLTLNYILAYFWNAIWLLYQLIIHACFEAIFRKKIYSTNFPPVLDFQCEASGRCSSWVRMCKAQLSRWLSDTSGRSWLYRVLIWQLPSERVSCAFGWVRYENYWTSNLASVCNSVQKNIIMQKIKRQIFCWWSGNSIKRKTTLGQPNPGYPLFRRQN